MSALRRIAGRAVTEDRLAGWHPALFAAYPVLFLWSQNVDEVPAAHALQPLLIIVAAALVVTLVLAVVIGDRARAALIVTPVVLGLLMYGHVVDLIPAPGTIHRLGWAALGGLALLGAWRLGPARLMRIDRILLGLSALLVVVTLVSIVPSQLQTGTTAAAPDLSAGRVLATTTSAPKRDVFLLTFDRYPSDRAIDTQFGIENDLTPWLRDQGFDVLGDSHANYIATSLSLSTTLNMRTLTDLSAGATSASAFRKRIYDSLQNSFVVQQFKALGYRYIHVGSWWNPTRIDSGADVNYNAAGASDFGSVLLKESAVPLALTALGITEQTFSKNYQNGRYELELLPKLGEEPGPKFVWAHVLLPHPAYVFNPDGSFMSAATARRLGAKEAWRRQHEYTNNQLRTIIGGLLALPEERRPIIILQADEGHWFNRDQSDDTEDDVSFDWSKATPEQIEIKFGILNAWYVPGDVDLALDPKMTAINTFPTLFDRYFGLDYPRLPDRVSITKGWNQDEAALDVTDRLPSLK